MKTTQTNIRRHQLKISTFPMTVSDLIQRLRQVEKAANEHPPRQVMVGFTAYNPIAVEGSLVIQWDELAQDEPGGPSADGDEKTEASA